MKSTWNQSNPISFVTVGKINIESKQRFTHKGYSFTRFTRDIYSAPQLRDLSRQSVFVFRHLNHSDPVYVGNNTMTLDDYLATYKCTLNVL